MVNLVIIQARMGSSRLPGKVLMKLEGKTILEHIIDFLKFSKFTDKIIVATSTNYEDDQIEKLCNRLEITCFRGSSKDVLNRYYECAKLYKGDIVVRITGDNPLIDPTIVDEAIELCKNKNLDYVSNMLHETYPLGYLVEVMKFSILKKNNDELNHPLTREHVTHHIRQNSFLYNFEEIFAPKNFHRSKWRLTIDTKNDFKLMKIIFQHLYKPDDFISYYDVVNFLDANLDLLKINQTTEKN